MGQLTVFRGDDAQFRIEVTQAGAALDLDGSTLWFTAKHSTSDADAEAVVKHSSAAGDGIVLTGGNVAVLTIARLQTEPIATTITLAYDLRMRTTDDLIKTLDTGKLVVHPNSTRRAVP